MNLRRQAKQFASLLNKIHVLSVLPYHGEPGKPLKKIVAGLALSGYFLSSKEVGDILQTLNKKPHKYAICWRRTKRWRQTRLGHEFLEKSKSL